MKKITWLYMIAFYIVAGSCTFTVGDKKEGVKTKPVTSSDNTTLNGATIKNDIDIDVTGVKLNSAYLVDADYKPLSENKTRIGEKIYVVLKMDTGWVKESGKSFIGASERILTSSGKVVVSADDIFKDYEATGLDAKDAKVVSLSAVITEAESVNNFEVQFKVWDKKSAAEVKGKYYFSLKKD